MPVMAPQWLPDGLNLLLLVGGALAVLGGWWRWIRPKWKKVGNRVTAALDTIVGRPPIVDSITGREIAPALDGVGVRQDRTERQVELLTSTVAKLADQEAAINELREATLQNTRDIAMLQASVVERVASKVEQTEMWKTVQRIQDGEPAVDGDVED